MKILVTGGTGFIGKALILELVRRNYSVVAATRDDDYRFPVSVLKQKINNSFEFEDSKAFQDVDTVIHCAARAHILKEKTDKALKYFRETNTKGTLKLARQAAEAGVKRFIFMSSIGVLGNSSQKPFVETDEPNPQEAYAVSKYEAELALNDLANETGLEIVIVRPPLVYGENAPGNFLTLMDWMSKNIWLPFGNIQNKRSFIFLGNLVDFVLICIKEPNAKNQIFLVSDNEDMSTTELLTQVSLALEKRPHLFSVNQKILVSFLKFIGKESLARRLCGSLQIDISKAKKILSWSPPFSFVEGLNETVKSYVSHR